MKIFFWGGGGGGGGIFRVPIVVYSVARVQAQYLKTRGAFSPTSSPTPLCNHKNCLLMYLWRV